MIKKLFLFILFSCFSVLTLSSCSEPASIYGNFSKELYVLDVGQEIDFKSQLNLTGIEYENIQIVFSNDEILQNNKDNYIALSSGKTYVFAKNNETTIAQTQVVVNYVFSSPSIMTISKEGVLQWEESHAKVDGKIVKANQYIVKIGDNRQFKVDDNKFDFKKEKLAYGRYQVEIIALGIDSLYIKDSQSSQSKTIVYDYMSTIEGLNVEVSTDFLNQQATISWNNIENALYDVYLDGYKINEQKLSSPSFTYDFSRFSNGKQIQLEVVAYDSQNEKIQLSTFYMLNKLFSIDPNYVYDSEMGYLFIEDSQNASEYIVSYLDENGINNGQKIVNANEKEFLDEIPNGIYNISIQAVGGNKGEEYYLNSNAGQSFKFAKLAMPEPDVKIEGEKITISFDEEYDSYVNSYLVKVGENKTIHNIEDGYQLVLDSSMFNDGENLLEVYALPTKDIDSLTGVKYYTQNEISTNFVLTSKAYTYNVYKLKTIEDITHQFESDSSKSQLIFENVLFADAFKVFVNDVPVPTIEMEIGESNTILTFDNLKSYSPNESNQYVIKIECYREDGQSINSYGLKTLSILSPVQKDVSENGQYNWSSVEGEVQYKYTIFNSDKDYQTSNFLLTEVTNDLHLKESLSFGYYKIEIVSVSTNTNLYLDSNFADEQALLKDEFLVYEQIKTPVVKFLQTESGFQLEISNVDYAGQYVIFLDEQEIDSFDVVNIQETYTRNLVGQNFDLEKEYKIEVLAKPGSKYDNNLHIDSEKAIVNVIRIAKPSFEVEEVYSIEGLFGIEGEKGTKVEENIVPTNLNDADLIDHYDILINGEKVNIENQAKYNLINQSQSFTLTLVAKAKQQEDNNYYLDSFANQIVVERLPAPTNFDYKDEVVSYQNDSNENIENYFVELELFTGSGNRTISFFTNSTEQSFNLQQKLEEFANNNSFNNELKQATKFGVRVWAYCQSQSKEGKLILQSTKATTNGGETQIIIEKMQAPVLSFDANQTQNILSWNAVGQDTVYDIYKNDSLVKEDYSGTSITLSSLIEENDFARGQLSFKVVSKNSKYLNSSASNIVNIAKLNVLQNVSISKNSNSWIAVLDIDDVEQSRRISKVLVNDEEVSFTTGENKIYIDLSKYLENSYTLKVKLEAKNNEKEDVYYINSDLFSFNLIDIKDQSLNAKVENDKIVWTSPYANWLEEKNAVSYKIVILANDTELFINNYTKTEILLSELETLTNSVFQAEKSISVSIYSQLSSYQTTISQTLYYGEIKQEGIEIKKVADIINETISIKLKETADLIDAYKSSQVLLQFENIWTGDVAFDLIINDSSSSFSGLTLDRPFADCSVSLNEKIYTVTLNNNLLDKAGVNKIYLKVNQQNLISSNTKEFSVSRNDDVKNASVDNHGILTVEYGDLASNKLLLKMVIGQDIVYKEFMTSQKEIDLQELLKDKSGNISMEFIVFDSELKTLSSFNSYTINNSKLEKIESIEVLDNGQMYFNISSSIYIDEESQIEFIVKTENGEEIQFYPTLVEGNLFRYEYSLDKLAELLKFNQAGFYNLSFANREVNFINSDFVDFDLGYAIEENESVSKQRESLNKDYLIFKELYTEVTGVSTVGFRFTIKNHLGEITKQINLQLSDGGILKGYWDANVNKFVENKPAYDEEEQIAKVYKCFAFSINDLFEDIEYGVYSLDAVRIAKQGDVYTIFNLKTFDIVKLNNVIEDVLSPLTVNIYENNLVWNWQKPEDESLPQYFKPSVYYVTIWPQNNETQKQVFAVSSNKLNLASINLTTGYNFINIQAVSDNANLLASSMLENDLSVYKYGQTKGLKLENGKIVFDLNKDGAIDKDIDLVSVFDTSTNGTNLADNLSLIGEDGFKDIYYFQTDSVEKQTIKLKFVATDSSGQTENGKVYYATVNALNLLSKFFVTNKDFVTQMYEYIEANKGSDSTTNFANLMAFYDKIITSSFGLTEYEVLFDDFGLAIPSGYYNLSAIQTATNVYDDFIDSNPSKSTLIYVASAPTMEMQNSYDSETGEELYTATFNCVDIVDENGILNKSSSYIMAFRKVSSSGEEGIYKFEISYNNSWSIKYNNTLLEGVISGDSDNSFTINFSALGDYQIDDIYLIDKNFEYNVYVYAVGNSNSCYGKASKFNLVFLNLEKENILVENGFINIITSKNEIGSDILVKYKKQYSTGSETTEQIVQMQTDEQGRAVLNDILPSAGLYDYVIFNVMGQINNDKKVMKLPSVSYGILNLYKLNNPILTTSNNELVISAQSNDSEYGPFNFMLDLGNVAVKSEKQYFDKTADNLSQLSFNHNANDYNIPEITNAYFVSKTIENFAIDDYQNENPLIPFFEKLVDFNGLIVISSATESISMQNLDSTSNLQLSKGNLTWDAVQRDDLQENVEIVYKVEVEYYDDGNNENIKAIESFWTQKNYFDTSLVSSKYSQGAGKGFNFNIYVYVGQKSDQAGVTLVEGGYFDISNSYQFENGKYILYSDPITKKELIKEKTPSFYDKEDGVIQVYDGKVVLNRAEEDEFDFDIKLIDSNDQRIDLVENVDYVIDRSGKIVIEGNLSNLVYFISIINNDFADGKPFKLEIYAYGKNTIKSDKITTNDLFKLKEISSEELEIVLQETNGIYQNALSFEKYFENNKFYFSNKVYKIEVYSLSQNSEDETLNYLGENYDLTSEKPIFEGIDNFAGSSLVFIVKAVNNNDIYLTSEKFEVSFESFKNPEEEILLSYNEEQYRFEWSVENNEEEYEFFIDLTYSDGQKETSYIKDFNVDNNKKLFVYQPNKMGNIEKVVLYARNINLQTMLKQDLSLGLYEQVASLSDVEYKLFAGGSGTQLDPYIVTNQEEFKNIALRDNANNQVYFKLNNSIDVDVNSFNQFAISSFYGVLDGNGQTINLNMQMSLDSAQEGSLNIEKSLTLGNTSSELTFDKAVSLFGVINKNASVSNLSLNYSFDYSAIESLESTIVSGLAYQNFGTLTNISVGSIDLPFTSNLSSFAVSGLVSINSGVIQDCQVDADISKVFPQKAITLIYGAIAILNENQGTIIGCANNGNVEITVRHAQAKVYMGGVVYENNASKILASGNNGALTTKGNYSYQCALAGVVVRNTSSQIDFVYNNGLISSSSSIGNTTSGIIYRQQYGTIGTMFETSNSGVITTSANGSVSIASGSKVYAYSNLTSIIANLEITNLTSLNDGDEFNYSSSYKILVNKTGDVYSISHQKL